MTESNGGVRAGRSPWLGLLGALAAAGCQSIGPATVTRDRLDYSAAITESWKHQTLLNIIKLRYSDPPLFVDVGQIISGYSLETSVSLGANSGPLRNESVGGSARFTDRPTITYVPLTGNRFLNGLLTPIAPASLFSTIAAGWPADMLMPIGVGSINGIANDELVSGEYRPADPRFLRTVELIRQMQLSRTVSLRVDKKPDGAATVLAFGRPDPASVGASTELRDLLGLDADATEFNLVYGDNAANGREIAMRTRSLLNILQLMAARAEVPLAHLQDGRASAGADAQSTSNFRGFRIQSAADEPKDAFVSVRYRDAWFFIDDRDLASKRVFTLIMLLFTLADTGADREGPVITVPAQ
jgi:hypothetical protein